MFDDWFLRWLEEVPDIYAILESISLLWAIWCGRNKIVFQHTKEDVLQDMKNGQQWYQMLCKLLQKVDSQEASSEFQPNSGNCVSRTKSAVLKIEDGCGLGMANVKVLVDGAWRNESWDGVVAWVDAANKNDGGTCKVIASLAFMTEALAVLKALKWVKSRGNQYVEICIDCSSVVKGLMHLDNVHVLVKPILLDILYVAKSFSSVCITKVARQMVGVAHTLAKQCML